jgi:hypothetical protein
MVTPQETCDWASRNDARSYGSYLNDPFFEPLPNPPLHASLADIPEKELVRRLVENPLSRADLLGMRGMPTAPLIFQALDLRGAPSSVRTDVDLLFVEANAPETAVAIEVKRIKVHAPTFASGTPNKLREYEKAVEQANLLARVGFAQVYLYVFVVVDSRHHNAGRVTYAGLTSELRARIDAVISLEGLEPRIGLVVHELVQPMDHPPLTVGAGGMELRRLATAAQQPEALTRWLAQLPPIRSPDPVAPQSPGS